MKKEQDTEAVVTLFNIFQQGGLIIGPMFGAFSNKYVGFFMTMYIGSGVMLVFAVYAIYDTYKRGLENPASIYKNIGSNNTTSSNDNVYARDSEVVNGVVKTSTNGTSNGTSTPHSSKKTPLNQGINNDDLKQTLMGG